MNICVCQINLKKKKERNLLNRFVSDLNFDFNCKINNVDIGFYSYSFNIKISTDNIQSIMNMISRYNKEFGEIDEYINIVLDIRFH